MEQMAMELQPVAIAAVMMVLDVLTGFAGAASWPLPSSTRWRRL